MEDILFWHLWIFLAIVLFISEIFTPGFIFFCIGVGASFTSVISFLEFSINIQFIIFSVTTLISLIFIRPILSKIYKNNIDLIKTNNEALISKKGIVIDEINNEINKGRVLIDGDTWRSKSLNNEIIKKNSTVQIVKIESTIIIVKNI